MFEIGLHDSLHASHRLLALYSSDKRIYSERRRTNGSLTNDIYNLDDSRMRSLNASLACTVDGSVKLPVVFVAYLTGTLHPCPPLGAAGPFALLCTTYLHLLETPLGSWSRPWKSPLCITSPAFTLSNPLQLCFMRTLFTPT